MRRSPLIRLLETTLLVALLGGLSFIIESQTPPKQLPAAAAAHFADADLQVN